MQAALTKGSVHGFATAVRGSPLSAPAPRVAPIVARNIRAEAAADKAAAKEAAPAAFVPPTLDASWPSPIFGGSTGGLLRKAQVEEFYVITWEGKKEQIFEMPTGKMCTWTALHWVGGLAFSWVIFRLFYCLAA